jgi:hypothetical protein
LLTLQLVWSIFSGDMNCVLTSRLVPKHDIRTSGVTVASLFFTNVFGHAKGVKVFNLLIALSAFGNLIAVQIGQSRVIRECGR